MRLLILTGLLLSCVGHGAALALSGWQEPDQNLTIGASVEKRILQAAVIATRLQTIYRSGDARRARTADFGFDFRIEGGLWALCATTVIDAGSCMAANCIDRNLCSTGCGFPDSSTMSTLTCTQASKAFCSMAILTHQSAVEPVTNFGCADDITQDHWKGFTDPFVELDTTTTSTSTSTSTKTSVSARSTSSVSFPTSTSSDPASTQGPAPSNARSGNEPSSSSSTLGPAADSSAQSNTGGVTNNMGAIIGGVVGCVALLCGFGLAAVWLLRRNKNANAKDKAPSEPPSTLDGIEGVRRDDKPELEAYERSELFGQSLSEMSARGPAAYDTALYRPNYPPMTPVELPVRASWK